MDPGEDERRASRKAFNSQLLWYALVFLAALALVGLVGFLFLLSFREP